MRYCVPDILPVDCFPPLDMVFVVLYCNFRSLAFLGLLDFLVRQLLLDPWTLAASCEARAIGVSHYCRRQLDDVLKARHTLRGRAVRKRS